VKLLLVVLVFAAVTYLAVRWLQDRGYGEQPSRRPRPKTPIRPVAPDDDESFLRDLEWRRRQQERHKDRPQPPDSPDA